ncbi:MAG: hypothetical protein ACRD2X_22340, partial [Vicinamibacteraceae bacterium]
MSTTHPSFNHLSDRDLLREVTRLAACEREATASLVASLAVLDRRRLYLTEGYASMFVYCTQALHLSEGSAYKRITAARAAQRFPVILERLAEGTISLATVNLLAAHLTVENHVPLRDEASQRSKREVEEIVARLRPRPDVPNTVRKLPAPTSPPPAAAVRRTTAVSAAPAGMMSVEPPLSRASTSSPSASETASAPTHGASATPNIRWGEAHGGQTAPANPPHGTVTPLAPARDKLTVTISAETCEKLGEARDLLRHSVPNGNLAVLLDRALTALLREATPSATSVLGRGCISGKPRAPMSAVAQLAPGRVGEFSRRRVSEQHESPSSTQHVRPPTRA